jgi:hypothetical protein
MDTLVPPVVLDAVIQVEVQVPSLTLVHLDPLSIKIELNFCTRPYRNVHSSETVLETQFVISMMPDLRAGE